MSLREVGVAHERGTRHRNRERSRDTRDEEARQQRRREHDRRGDERQGNSNGRPGPASRNADSRSQARQIEHQSSLRSLISSSDVDPTTMEEEILRQIVEEGLLNGIDLDNLDASQEDDLSERIADAYRRRHGHQTRPQESRTERVTSSGRRSHRSNPDQSHHRSHGRSPGAPDQIEHSSHPPISRPRLLEAYPTGQRNQRRASSDNRRQTSPAPVSSSGGFSSDGQTQAARSATDLSDRPRTSGNQRQMSRVSGPSPSRASFGDQRQAAHSVTDLSGRPQSSGGARPRQMELPNHGRSVTDPDSLSRHSRDRSRGNPTHIPRAGGGMETVVAADMTPRNTSNAQLSVNVATPTQLSFPPNPDQNISAAPYPLDSLNSTTKLSSSRTSSNKVPSITCNRCNRPHLEYELHQNCSSCLGGNYNLCFRCYRRNLGCLHWYGFGHAALQRYQRQTQPAGYPPSHSHPHILVGHRYLSLAVRKDPFSAVEGNQKMISQDMSDLLQSGVFCSNCSAFANNCFWRCDICNEGEWGFCDPCVNQGKCCTHPLLPLAHASTKSKYNPLSSDQPSEAFFTPTIGSKASSSTHVSMSTFPGNGPYHALTFSIKCKICTYPIPPSTTRFHCAQCNAGDYDICTECYLNLVSTGRISADNSHKGWRRCPQGHRMIIVGFQDSPAGQRRTVVHELVGGHALKDDSPFSSSIAEDGWKWHDDGQVQTRILTQPNFPPPSSTSSLSTQPPPPPPSSSSQPSSSSISSQPPLSTPKFPPNGGVGMRLVARWSYLPDEDAENELSFPKGALLNEVQDINGDWFWGVYAGATGVFPGNYGRVVEIV